MSPKTVNLLTSCAAWCNRLGCHMTIIKNARHFGRAFFIIRYLVNQFHVVNPQDIAGRADVGTAVAGCELHLQVGRGIVRVAPANFLDRNAFAFAVDGIAYG